MNKIVLITAIFFISFLGVAQEIIEKPAYLKLSIDTISKHRLYTALDDLFLDIDKDMPLEKHASKEDQILTNATLNLIKKYHHQFKGDATKRISHQISNVYPIGTGDLTVVINGLISRKEQSPILLYTVQLIAKASEEGLKFSIPLKQKTQHWKSKTVGHITYHYRNSLNTERAYVFNTKNQKIAKKFNLEPDSLQMYMCEDYQEILQLRGILYSINANGNYRDRYGVVDNTIFSVMNHEDFSHDMLHYYSGKIHTAEDRNWVAEEGLAYLWGNAYYTDANREMIEQHRLILELKNYLDQTKDADLYDMFNTDAKIYNHIAPEISVRSVIAGIILNEIEKHHGLENVVLVINAGSANGAASFLKMANQLLNISSDNFHKKVLSFLEE